MKNVLLSSFLLILTACAGEKEGEVPAGGNTNLSPQDSAFVTAMEMKVIHHFDETGNYEEAKLCLDSARHRLESLNLNSSLPMSALLNLEAVYWQRRFNNRDTAISLLSDALEMAEQELGADSPELGDMLCNLSVMYRENSDFGKSEQLALRAIAGFQTDSTRYNDQIIATLINLSVTYSYAEKYEQSLPLLYRALSLSEATPEKKLVRHAEVYTHISKVYRDLQDYKKALEYRMKAIDIYQSMDPSPIDRLLSCYNNLGLIHSDMGNSEEAIEWYRKAEPLYKTAYGDSTPRIATLWDNMAHEYRIQGNVTKAIELHEMAQALEIAHFGEEDRRVATGRGLLAKAYNQAGRYQESLVQLKKALKVNKLQFGPYSEKVERNHRNMAETYRLLKNMDMAFVHLDSAMLLRDSILTRERISSLSEMSEKYESEMKDTEIALLNSENQRKEAERIAERNKRFLTMGVGVTLLLSVVGGGTVVLRNRRVRFRAELDRQELRRKLTENDFLRSRLEPHFVANALEAIDQLVESGRADTAREYIDRFNRLMRWTLENSDRPLVPLSQELTMLEHYLSLGELWSPHGLKWQVKVAEGTDIEDVQVPPLILQPLVENALKHGTAPLEVEGRITVSALQDGDRIVCRVEDNGPGISTIKPLSQASQGMRLTRERLALFSELQGADAELTMENTGSGTCASVTFTFSSDQ